MSSSPWLLDRSVTFRGSALATHLLGAFGWRVQFDGMPARQGVLVVYPHTSNWDFIVGLLAKWSIGLPVAFWGKDSLFAMPVLGRWMRWLGGVPVDRSSPGGVVETMVERLRAARRHSEFFWLALAPEGTRAYSEHWRSGFYRVALQADVPLALAYLDFEQKVVGVDAYLRLSGDAGADMALIAARLGHRRGCRPDLAAPIRLPAKDVNA
jgi:1-acyl-sn-glycerol-3-phosphate acyltransferase